MADPTVTAVSNANGRTNFKCDTYNTVNITGTNFTSNVHVTLHETHAGKNHDWIQQSQPGCRLRVERQSQSPRNPRETTESLARKTTTPATSPLR